MSSTYSAALEASASDSNEPECVPSPSASATSSAEPCSPSTGLASHASKTFTPLTQADWIGSDPSILSAEVSPASPSPLQDASKPKLTTVTSGRRCVRLLHLRDPLGSLAKTLLESSHWRSTLCWLTWKASGTPAGRLLFRLVPSMRDIGETGFGSLLATPTTKANQLAPSTPAATNYGTNQGGAAGRVGPIRPSLETMARHGLWPTPTAMNDTGGAALCKWGGARSREKIRAMVGDKELNGPLNPEWVEWLMGFPEGWTDLGPSETRSFRKSSKKSAEQS